jgi:hypothetical protein
MIFVLNIDDSPFISPGTDCLAIDRECLLGSDDCKGDFVLVNFILWELPSLRRSMRVLLRRIRHYRRDTFLCCGKRIQL